MLPSAYSIIVLVLAFAPVYDKLALNIPVRIPMLRLALNTRSTLNRASTLHSLTQMVFMGYLGPYARALSRVYNSNINYNML